MGDNLRSISYVSYGKRKKLQHIGKRGTGHNILHYDLRQYSLGNKFVLKTHHKSLTTLFDENKGLPIMASARMHSCQQLLDPPKKRSLIPWTPAD